MFYIPNLCISNIGVSCDACMRGNFKGRRFKCLKCYDYDLCANCYEAGATTPRHSVDHPMQCILTRADFELYYGGESLATEQPQAFTCPFCGRMGLTETMLTEHVTAEHPDSTTEVVSIFKVSNKYNILFNIYYTFYLGLSSLCSTSRR